MSATKRKIKMSDPGENPDNAVEVAVDVEPTLDAPVEIASNEQANEVAEEAPVASASEA